MSQCGVNDLIKLFISSLLMLLPLFVEPAGAQTQTTKSANSWTEVWQKIVRRRDQDRSRTSRGIICPVVPQFVSQRLIWRDRPIFVWQGKAETISVSNFPVSSQPLWSRNQLENKNLVAYTGKPLQPGTQYLWKAENGTDISQVIFQTLDQTSRDRITAQLTHLETRLNQQNITPEEKVKQRVQFFLDQNLFLDAIQELYTLPQPSPELKAIQQQLTELTCLK